MSEHNLPESKDQAEQIEYIEEIDLDDAAFISGTGKNPKSPGVGTGGG